MTEISTIELEDVRGGIGFWGSFGLNIASKAIQGAMSGAAEGAKQGKPLRGALMGAAREALGATAGGLGQAAQGAAG